MQADLTKKWDYENGYYLTASKERVGKVLNQWELFKHIPKGDIIEVGVLKGASLSRFAIFRDLLGYDCKIYGFDTFGHFPRSKRNQDFIDSFVSQAGEALPIDEVQFYLDSKGHEDIHLIEGDIFDTLPLFLHSKRPKLGMIHIDVDAYEPTKFALQQLIPFMVTGGIIMLDDYHHCEGAKAACDEVLSIKPTAMPHYVSPVYVRV